MTTGSGLTVPATAIVSIEHPFVVQRREAAIESLGGVDRLERFLSDRSAKRALGLRLRPGDALCRPILSRSTPSTDVLVRVSVPKRTGRRRPKGSSGPFEPFDQDSKPADTRLLRAIRDHPDRLTAHPVGVIWDSVRFRNLPDMQFDTGPDPLMDQVRADILLSDFSRVDQKPAWFDISTIGSNPDTCSVGLPAAFCHLNSQFNYAYEQNPAIRTIDDGVGGQMTVNLQAMRGYITHAIPLDSPTVPTESPVQLIPRHSVHADLQDAICELEAVLAKRPIVSRRVARNLCNPATLYCQRFAWAYLGYVFKTGPWKDCLIRFGVDPRIDPECRQYQTLSFQFSNTDKSPATDKIGEPDGPSSLVSKVASPVAHIFDGQRAYLDGKTWQTCDITDPDIRQVLDSADVPEKPDLVSNGWYRVGTLVVLRAIFRDKIQGLMSGVVVDRSVYRPFLSWPAVIEVETAAVVAAAVEAGNPGPITGVAAMAGRLRLPSSASEKQREISLDIRLKLGSTVINIAEYQTRAPTVPVDKAAARQDDVHPDVENEARREDEAGE